MDNWRVLYEYYTIMEWFYCINPNAYQETVSKYTDLTNADISENTKIINATAFDCIVSIK